MADQDIEDFTLDIGESGRHAHEDHSHDTGAMRSVD
jgi:hypothetical protein